MTTEREQNVVLSKNTFIQISRGDIWNVFFTDDNERIVRRSYHLQFFIESHTFGTIYTNIAESAIRKWEYLGFNNREKQSRYSRKKKKRG